ncbi:MAG: hypothetical protein S4CHLAM20_07910 [Chlamydiia bacterium]|nr:hypothetical protein [Chlamydiia bacterium]
MPKSVSFGTELPKTPDYINPFPRTHSNYNMPVEYIGMGSFSDVHMNMIVICSRNYDFNFNTIEQSQGYFNVMDHLPQLLKGAENKIALVTYQNGINTSKQDWITMAHHLAHTLPQGTIIIGLYNPTQGILKDIPRTFHEKSGTETYSVKALRAFHTSLLDIMDKHASKARCIHIPHSEAGAIYCRSFERMSLKNQAKMQNYFFVEAIAPAESIPKAYGIDAWNYYSLGDLITGPLASKPTDRYNIKWVDAISPFLERTLCIADHAFMGATYQGVREDVIKKYKNHAGGFYVGNSR